ncbi:MULTISPECIES: glycosyltransferase family 2 protein [Sphingobium]|jgi:glycosyltransferase involved in cell wall biosynthesis|uniref:Glycosyltransferase 2-like domain-containing protein n=2 Tax=Sphingobium TaxID=165695 RepID=T0GP26_9SPHN|nr:MULTISPECIES: glycosyltransferase [Sphingobium]EQB02447.1 hypothetical protein L485_08025 [Sphingobium baderi LL03]KMS60832.1 hypothetical protein V475_18095 [Sphingobium baderi LL03]TWH93421.1 glycosyl transferase family 2 [Sphingobium wenxiniae]
MEISLVIPVWNDPDGLKRLLRQVDAFAIFKEVIVCDDASDNEYDFASWELSPEFQGKIIHLRSEVQRGAGHGRNIGLARATGDYLIFFDSDDLFEAGFLQIVAALAQPDIAPDFDFCIFRHHDSRMLSLGQTGTFSKEEQLWQAVQAEEAPRLLDSSQILKLCSLAAYPWNKIYRTAFLKQHDLRCTELPVHNDIELHWTSFLRAEAVLCTSVIGATHFVAMNGERLTNRRNDERIRVFEAFENVRSCMARIPPARRLRFLEPFLLFARNLMSWIGENMDEDHHDEMIRRSQEFFLDGLDTDLMTLLAYRNPALAGSINTLLAQGKLG